MLELFLSLPAPAAVKSDQCEAYELSWRPVGARPMSAAISEGPRR